MDYENYGYKGEELHDYMRFCEDLKRVLYRSHVCRILEEQVMDFQRLLCTREKFDKDPSATTRRYEKFTLDLEAIHQRRNSIRQDEERIYTYIAQKGMTNYSSVVCMSKPRGMHMWMPARCTRVIHYRRH